MSFTLSKALAVASLITMAFAPGASAAVIAWTDWTSATCTNCAVGTATGTSDGLGVSYTGEILYLQTNYPSWTPTPTFQGGTIDNAPAPTDGMIGIRGVNPNGLNSIVFSTPVKDPVMAFWSLGQPGLAASFNFTAGPFSIQSSGTNTEYTLPSNLFQNGNILSGTEGSGTIQFTGTFSSISWTNTAENWFGFTVGRPVPEPSTIALIAMALLSMFGFGAMRKRAEA